MVGLPSSGKTTRAHEIQKYFVEHHNREVVLISDNEIICQMNVEKNVLFLGNYIFCFIKCLNYGTLKNYLLKNVGCWLK